MFILFEIHWDPCPRIFTTYFWWYKWCVADLWYVFRSENIWTHCVQAGNCSMYCDQRILQMVLSYFPGFCKEIIPNSCWSICDLIWLKSIIYPLCNTYLLLMYVHTTKVWMTYIIYIRRLVALSTDQAIPSCFYFRISWILMEQHSFIFFCPLRFVQGLRSLKHWLLQKLIKKNLDQKFKFLV